LYNHLGEAVVTREDLVEAEEHVEVLESQIETMKDGVLGMTQMWVQEKQELESELEVAKQMVVAVVKEKSALVQRISDLEMTLDKVNSKVYWKDTSN